MDDYFDKLGDKRPRWRVRMGDETRKKIKSAREMISDLCQGRCNWTMSIPAQPDRDPDLVISAGLDAADAYIKRLEEGVDWALIYAAALLHENEWKFFCHELRRLAGKEG